MNYPSQSPFKRGMAETRRPVNQSPLTVENIRYFTDEDLSICVRVAPLKYKVMAIEEQYRRRHVRN